MEIEGKLLLDSAEFTTLNGNGIQTICVRSDLSDTKAELTAIQKALSPEQSMAGTLCTHMCRRSVTRRGAHA
jgi:hypothetical protein